MLIIPTVLIVQAHTAHLPLTEPHHTEVVVATTQHQHQHRQHLQVEIAELHHMIRQLHRRHRHHHTLLHLVDITTPLQLLEVVVLRHTEVAVLHHTEVAVLQHRLL